MKRVNGVIRTAINTLLCKPGSQRDRECIIGKPKSIQKKNLIQCRMQHRIRCDQKIIRCVVHNMRCRIRFVTYDIVCRTCDVECYIRHRMSYIRHRKLRHRISNDTISYVPSIRYRSTISYVLTYDIVCWQESRCTISGIPML